MTVVTRPGNEKMDRLSFYLREYERLRKLKEKEKPPPGLPRIERKFTQEFIVKCERDHVYFFLDKLVEYLDDTYNPLNEWEKLHLLQHALKELDNRFSNPLADNKVSPTGPIGSGKDVFIKSWRFWKQYKKKPPNSYRRPWRTFGLYDPDYPTIPKPINLDDLSDRQQFNGGIDVLSRMNELKIGLFPLSEDYSMHFEMTATRNRLQSSAGFRAMERAPGTFEADLDAAVNAIRDEDIHIACFPEMSVCEPALQYLLAECDKLQRKFLILVAGSFHRKTGTGLYKNTLPVFISFSGQHREQYEYSKHELFNIEINATSKPFLKKFFTNYKRKPAKADYLEEDIQRNSSLLVMNSKRFGDLGFVICKDFLPNFSHLVENYTLLVDHLFVISLNVGKKADFQQIAQHFEIEHGIAVYYTNARCCDPNLTSPTFVNTPKDGLRLIDSSLPHLVYTWKARSVL